MDKQLPTGFSFLMGLDPIKGFDPMAFMNTLARQMPDEALVELTKTLSVEMERRGLIGPASG